MTIIKSPLLGEEYRIGDNERLAGECCPLDRAPLIKADDCSFKYL